MLKTLTPQLYTLKVEKTLAFYVEKLRFSCIAKDAKEGWAHIRLDNVNIIICEPNNHLKFKQPLFTGSFYIECDNVDDLWNQYNINSQIAYPIENFDYGMREFAIYDNNGYMLQFGQPF
ncbi:VOC family protein [Portibacter marinus]|uniref:hypothetical protein n=1 Tax=Portibacter marinus TaxID=2898660 RepID=UPI001F2CD84B|nr:hypothetical protein [Portibacter marinus]